MTEQHVAVLEKLRNDDIENLAERPDGDPRWRSWKSKRIEAIDAAIAAWNRRPASTPASGEVVAWPSGVLNKADTLDILTRHNAWRRGAKTNQTDPRMLGLALDAVIAALQEANHAG